MSSDLKQAVLTWIPDSDLPKTTSEAGVTIKCVLVSSKNKDVGKSWVLDFSKEGGGRKIEKGNGVSQVWRSTLGLDWRVVASDGEKTVTVEYKKA